MADARKKLIPLLFLFALALSPRPLGAQLTVTPPDTFEAAFTYPGQTLAPEDAQAELEIVIRNTGLRGDTFLIEVTRAPAGWTTDISRYNSVVTGVFIAAEENSTLTLSAYPPDDTDALPEGAYEFGIKVTAERTGKSVESSTVLTVSAGKAAKEPITLSTSYPEIGGPSDGRFAFSVDIKNNGPDEAKVNLAAEVPEGWEHSFKPGYEDKQISSIQVPKGQSRSVNLDLTPAYKAGAGSYPVKVTAATPEGEASVQLTVNLTGTFQLRAATANDLLSVSTEVGKPVSLNLYVINEGSAPQREVSFLAVNPNDWEVAFEPETVQNLEPGSVPATVKMTITPSASALVGDYGVGVSVSGEKSQSNLDFRVTVKAGSGWAWVGGIIIVVVVALLAWTFRKLGRR
ncbi:MAG: hypothetical protein LBR53_01605 [Deltaproteobacteria bacterium]|jgi:uncharacterized membrane protein|nr:hypothetical protein [Deltaproteobacteria bacterium]